MGFFSSSKPAPASTATSPPPPPTLAETANIEADEATNYFLDRPRWKSHRLRFAQEVDKLLFSYNSWKKKNDHPGWLEEMDESGFLPLHLAAGESHVGRTEVTPEIFESILTLYPEASKVRSNAGGIPLLYAANHPISDNKTKITQLINAFPDGKYVKDKKGNTPYDIANLRKEVYKELVDPDIIDLLKPPDNAVGGSRKRKRKTRRNKKRKSRKSRKYKK
jgi:hypothetical protein